MAKPTQLPLWATDLLFTNGPAADQGTNTKVEPDAAAKAEGQVPGNPIPAAHENWRNNLIYDWIRYLDQEFQIDEFGDGSDGNGLITGGVTTMTRNMYWDDLDIDATGELRPDGYIIHVRGTLTVAAGGGWINRDGADGGDGGAGAGGLGGTGHAFTNRVLAGGINGVAGGFGVGAAGTNGNNMTHSYGGAGGGGGIAGAFGPSLGGTVAEPLAEEGSIRSINNAKRGYVIGLDGAGDALWVPVFGGASGGGGAANAVAHGGGGSGAGGGVAVILARNLVLGGTISANGGSGGNGFDNTGQTGGGGGGGGGTLIVITRDRSGAGFYNAVAGGGGLGRQGGGNGSSGAAGQVFQFSM